MARIGSQRAARNLALSCNADVTQVGSTEGDGIAARHSFWSSFMLLTAFGRFEPSSMQIDSTIASSGKLHRQRSIFSSSLRAFTSAAARFSVAARSYCWSASCCWSKVSKLRCFDSVISSWQPCMVPLTSLQGPLCTVLQLSVFQLMRAPHCNLGHGTVLINVETWTR